MDVIGYSKLLIHQQSDLQKQLNETVRATRQFQIADSQGKLIRLPTGDGMVLVFFNKPDAPIECALEISAALRNHPGIPLRMGIHSGPVNEVMDVNERVNVAGAGIDLAQRVMDYGDAGHILLSKRVADDLAPYDRWHPHLHEIGEYETKHGQKISLVNFYTSEVGNSKLPSRLQALAEASPSSRAALFMSGRKNLVIGAIGLLVLLGGGWWFLAHHPAKPTAAVENFATSTDVGAKSIAVLPLDNLSEDKQDAFFADGIQDDIVTSLAKIADLKVISRTSVMQYRNAKRNLREIGKALGVANIVEGSVRRAGDRVLVNVQLIDAEHDRHLWAERYDRTLADSIGLQGELATEIAIALKAKLAPQEKTRLATKPTNNPEAYLFYLQANELIHVAASKQEALNADELYAQAIALDPAFALSRARASMLNSQMYLIGRDPARKVKARLLADEALRLAPNLSEGHMALGLCYYRTEADYDQGLKELAIAGATSPNNSEILDLSGYIFRRQGRWRDALTAFEHAKELDPRRAHFEGRPETLRVLRQWTAANDAFKQALQLESQLIEGWRGLAYVEFAQSGEPAKAGAILDRLSDRIKKKASIAERWDYSMMARDFAAAEKMLPDFPTDEFPAIEPRQYYDACLALVRKDLERAHSFLTQITPEHETAVHDHPNDPTFHAALGKVYALLGRKEEALREARRAIDLCPESKDAVEGPAYATNLAFVYAQSGEVEKAITLLARLLTTPGPERITLAHLRLSWEWDPLREDPRFQKILESPEPATIYH
jgi:TolB-like protein/Tfp pilus assembly protein PilF